MKINYCNQIQIQKYNNSYEVNSSFIENAGTTRSKIDALKYRIVGHVQREVSWLRGNSKFSSYITKYNIGINQSLSREELGKKILKITVNIWMLINLHMISPIVLPLLNLPVGQPV